MLFVTPDSKVFFLLDRPSYDQLYFWMTFSIFLLELLLKNDIKFQEWMLFQTSADPEGGQGVQTPWKITSYMGFYRK